MSNAERFVRSEVGPDGQPQFTMVSARGRLVRFDGPEASRLADIISICGDLKKAVACFELLAGRVPSQEAVGLFARAKPAEAIVTSALFSMGVTKYSRPFVRGVRQRLVIDDLIVGRPDQPALHATHDSILNLRDRHVAHAVDASEGGLVGALLADNERRVIGLETTHGELQAPWRERALEFRNLALICHEVMSARYDDAHAQALAVAERDIEQLYLAPPFLLEVAESSRPRREPSRRRTPRKPPDPR